MNLVHLGSEHVEHALLILLKIKQCLLVFLKPFPESHVERFGRLCREQ